MIHGFTDVMEQHGKAQHLICPYLLQCMNRMLSNRVAVMSVLLLCLHHHIKFRQENRWIIRFEIQQGVKKIIRPVSALRNHSRNGYERMFGKCVNVDWKPVFRFRFRQLEKLEIALFRLFQQMDPGKTFDWKTCSANFRVPRGKRDAKRLGYARIQVKIYRAAATGQVKSFQLEKIGR